MKALMLVLAVLIFAGSAVAATETPNETQDSAMQKQALARAIRFTQGLPAQAAQNNDEKAWPEGSAYDLSRTEALESFRFFAGETDKMATQVTTQSGSLGDAPVSIVLDESPTGSPKEHHAVLLKINENIFGNVAIFMRFVDATNQQIVDLPAIVDTSGLVPKSGEYLIFWFDGAVHPGSWQVTVQAEGGSSIVAAQMNNPDYQAAVAFEKDKRGRMIMRTGNSITFNFQPGQEDQIIVVMGHTILTPGTDYIIGDNGRLLIKLPPGLPRGNNLVTLTWSVERAHGTSLTVSTNLPNFI